MKRLLLGRLFGLLCLSVSVSWAGSVAADNAYADAVLEALAGKGLLTAQEVHDIKLVARQAERDASGGDQRASNNGDKSLLTRSAEAIKAIGQAGSAKTVAKPAAGFPSYRVWGRLQPRLTYVPSDDGREGTSSLTMRRARFGLKGYLAKKIPFRYQYEAANEVDGLANATNLLDAWVGFEHFRDQIGDIIVGQQFVPGYTRAPQLTASVERKFSEFLYPGAAGRAKGVSVRRGDTGRPETSSKGIFDNRLHYGIGVFNGPDLSLNNDNNEMLFAATVGWRPTGQSIWPDEYALKERGFNYGFNAAFATSHDTATLDTGVQSALGNRVEMDNDWYSLFADVEYRHWVGWAAWTQFISDASDGQVIDTDGVASDSLNSKAWGFGGSRTFPISGNPDLQGWAVALQYQSVNNEHPSRTRFFRNLTGRSADEVGRGMNRGQAYHAMVTFILNPSTRIINEFTHYDGSHRSPDHDALVSQLQIDF